MSPSRGPTRLSRSARLQVEALETRNLLVASVNLALLPTFSEQEPNDTLDLSTDWQDLTVTGGALVSATIGNGSAGGADVDWYTFSLDQAAQIQITSAGTSANNANATILSLYNNDLWDFYDLFNPTGHRQLFQAEPNPLTGATQIDRPLAPGTYYLAVSGAGNRDFYPFLANSGLPGSTGSYSLQITATDLVAPPDVLSIEVSPQIIRLGLNVVLPDFPTATLTNSLGQDVVLAWSNYTLVANELQLAPSQALLPGDYTVNVTDFLGDTILTASVQVSADPNSEAATATDDTPATAHDLGDITQAGLVRRPGAIGDDPYYDGATFDPMLFPGNDVDLYHFRISGSGLQVVIAEVYAGRIGSPLDAGVSLYRLDPQDNLLYFITGNNQSFNPTGGTDFLTPLFTDSFVSAGLPAGDYFVAVSQGSNTPSPDEYQFSGPDSGIFDPNVSHSGFVGWNVGSYVLNLISYPATTPPHLESASIQEGATLSVLPTELTLQFTAPVNLDQLAFTAFQQTLQSTINAIYIQSGDGLIYYPRLVGYDHSANVASFLLLDALPNGEYQLHLSGAAGLTDLAGQPLQGNDSSGDFVIGFTVEAPLRGSNGDPLSWVHQVSDGVAQDLGVLFPEELQAGVTITRDFSVDPAASPDSQLDAFRFQILQNQTYVLSVTGTNLDPFAPLSLLDNNDQPIFGAPAGDGQTFIFLLTPGTYQVIINNTALDSVDSGGYQLSLVLLGASENAPPLLSGPAPAVRIRLVTSSPPSDGEVPPIILPDPPGTPPNPVPDPPHTPVDPPTVAPPTLNVPPISAPVVDVPQDIPLPPTNTVVSPIHSSAINNANTSFSPVSSGTLTSLSFSAFISLTIVPLRFESNQGTLETGTPSFQATSATVSGFAYNNAISRGLEGLQDGLAGKLAGEGSSAEVAWNDLVEIRLPAGSDTAKNLILPTFNQSSDGFINEFSLLEGSDDTVVLFDGSPIHGSKALRPRGWPLLHTGKDLLLARFRWHQVVSPSVGDEPLSWSRSSFEPNEVPFDPPALTGRTSGAGAEKKRPSVFECLQAGVLTCAGMAGIATAWIESKRGRLQLWDGKDNSPEREEHEAGRTDGQ